MRANRFEHENVKNENQKRKTKINNNNNSHIVISSALPFILLLVPLALELDILQVFVDYKQLPLPIDVKQKKKKRIYHRIALVLWRCISMQIGLTLILFEQILNRRTCVCRRRRQSQSVPTKYLHGMLTLECEINRKPLHKVRFLESISRERGKHRRMVAMKKRPIRSSNASLHFILLCTFSVRGIRSWYHIELQTLLFLSVCLI